MSHPNIEYVSALCLHVGIKYPGNFSEWKHGRQYDGILFALGGSLEEAEARRDDFMRRLQVHPVRR